MSLDIQAIGGEGIHTFRKVNVNLAENYVYFANRDSGTLYPTAVTDDSAWVFRNSTGSITGIDSETVYYTNTDQYSISFATSAGGTNIDITEYAPGTITLNYPNVFQESLNISSVKYDNQQAVKYYTDSTPINGLVSGGTYFVKNELTGLGGSSLYEFSDFTFTTGGVTGQTGPTIEQLRSAYSSADWRNAYLAQGTFQGYQDWTVPEDGVYEFTVKGAPGRQGRALGGGGAIIRGRVRLNKNEIITIVCGQRGALPDAAITYPGSSGASFVVRKNGNIPLFVAGGGSSSSNTLNGLNAVTTNNGGASNRGLTGGTSGNGSPGRSSGGGGGGFFSAGGNSTYGTGGLGFNNGLVGGNPSNTGNGGRGGFGGGGGADGSNFGNPGGAGGYSGGASQDGAFGVTGGGGSFVLATATNVATSNGLYNGSNNLLGQPITDLSSYNTGDVEGEVFVELVERSVFGFKLYPTATDAEAEENAIPIEAAGSEFHSLVPITLDLASETINVTTPHGLIEGEGVQYFFNGVSAQGLDATTVYYVDRVDDYSYKLSLTPDPNFTSVNITAPSNSTVQGLRRVIVNTATDTITINNHGFLVDQPVRYSSGTGTPIAPLQNNSTYYIKDVVDENRFSLTQSLQGPAINFTSPGTGTSHSFILTVVNDLEDTLYVPTHGYVSGQTVKYQKARDFVISNITSSGTTRVLNTTEPHGIQVGSRLSIDGFTRPAISAPSIVVTRIASSGQTRTLTLAANHNLATGMFIQVSGLTGAQAGNFNGVFVVTGVPTGNTLTYTAEVSVTLVETILVGTSTLMQRKPEFEFLEHTRVLTVRSIASSGTTRTIVTNEPHYFSTGYPIWIQGISGSVPGIQGDIGEYFNGIYFLASTPSTNTFTYVANHDGEPSNLQPSITFTTLGVGSGGVNAGGTAYREVVASAVSSTAISYVMPQSSLTVSPAETVTGRVSKIGVRVNNRNLINTTLADMTFDVVHDLQVGDKFTVRTLSGTNQDVFRGTYRVKSIPTTSRVQFDIPQKTVPIARRRLASNTAIVVNTTTPHDFISGNFVFLENNSGLDSKFWNNTVDILNRSSEGTTRTITTDNPHYLSVGERFKITGITGANPELFNGEWTVATVPNATTITFTGTTSVSIPQVTVTGSLVKAYSISQGPGYTVSARSRTSNVADVTFTGNHDLQVGEQIRIDNIGGVNPELFNGEWTISAVPAANRVQFVTPASGTVANASVSGNVNAVNQIRYSIPTYTRALASRELVSHTVARFTTTFDHFFEVGTTITISSISGTSQNVFNGTWVIASVPTARSFTVTRTPQANVTTFTVTNRNRSVNVADITFNTTHGLKVGDTITISNITGSDPEVFNGTHVVTGVPTTSRVQFFTLTNGAITAAAVSGTIQVERMIVENVSGTTTLNTIPTQTPTSGNLLLREVAALSMGAELVTDTEIPGLQNQTIYYIQRVDANTVRLFNDKNLTSSTDISGVGIGSHSLVTFSVNFDDDTLIIPNNGFSLGELVEYDTIGQTAISGLTSGVPYYVIPVDGNTFRLATTSQNAQDGVYINLVATPAPVGRHKLKSLIRTPDGTYTIGNVVDANTFEVAANGSVPEIVKTFNPRTSIDLNQNFIKIPSHGFNTGTEVTYLDGGETSIGGLTNDTHYYVIVVNKDWIRLSESEIDANSGVPLTLTTFGAGGAHSLTTQQINGQITGTGTITTTAGSVLVSGSGTSFSKIIKVGDRFRIFPPDITQSGYFAASEISTSTEVVGLAAHPFVTGDSVIFSPGSGGPRRDIFQISGSTTTRTIRTREPHGYTTGNNVTISGLSSAVASDFVGTYAITGTPDTYSFTYNHPVSLTGTITNEYQTTGVAQTSGSGGVAPNPLVDGYFYFIRAIPNASTFSINNRRRFTDGGTTFLEFTTTATHNIRAGNTFTVTSISGVNPEVFNGTFIAATTPSATTIRVVLPTTAIDIASAVVTGTLTPNSSNSVTLHALKSDAEDNINAVDFATQGSGLAMTLTKITPSTPIVREIAAIGSDTQLTVNRPYSTTFTGINFSYPTFLYVRPQGYSLHRPFDGGVEMSTGFGTWYGSIIRQTRKYFRYQSGKGIQTSAGINFKPSIDIESIARIGTSQNVAVRTRRPHGLINGLFCRIDDCLTSQGVLSTVFNGTFQVTVIDSFNFTFIATNTIVEPIGYGYPRLHVTAWENGALRAGMFDFQNGMFFEFDGQKLYAVRRSSTQQIAGTCAALQGSELVFGTDTQFTRQLTLGDYIVLRGQSYKVASIDSDTRISIKPEYKGSSGAEKEFIPGDGTTGVVKVESNYFNIINHGFSQNLPVVYNSIDGSPIGGLITGRTYYVDVVDNNRFRLKANPDATQNVTISSSGTGTPHSFTPAKTGIIATLTVDTRTPQEQWSIDPSDGSGPTGYDLDLSKIQMIYMDYSWYGAGKIRYGFKTVDGQVRYVHEYVHNNQKYESYFRSGNLPGRYEVTTFDNPTYIPSLFHWGTSVMMDGGFDDDRAYLFSKSSPSLNIGGTTAKSFGSTAINTITEIINIPSHGFNTGDAVTFTALSSSGTPQANAQNPGVEVISGVQTSTTLQNSQIYYIRAINTNNVIVYPSLATSLVAPATVSSRSKSNGTVTITTSAAHGFSIGDSVWINLSTDSAAAGYNGSFRILSVPTGTTFTYNNGNQGFIFNNGSATPPAGSIAAKNVINFVNQGNSTGTYTFTPAGSLNNSSGANYQPLISLRLSPSVSEGLTGALGDRDVINRMQLRLNEIGVQTNQLIDVKVLLNGRLNNLNFQPVDNPSLVQVIEHTSNDTISGGVQVYNFRANGNNGVEQTTLVDISQLFELSNSILGGNSVFPDGPDIITIAVARLTGSETLASAKLSWAEAQA
jgi:hypothetical protein